MAIRVKAIVPGKPCLHSLFSLFGSFPFFLSVQDQPRVIEGFQLDIDSCTHDSKQAIPFRPRQAL